MLYRLMGIYQSAIIYGMPRKIKALIADLKKAGFSMSSGKGSHRVFKHDTIRAIISGKEGADARRYQEKDVAEAIKEAKKS